MTTIARLIAVLLLLMFPCTESAANTITKDDGDKLQSLLHESMKLSDDFYRGSAAFLMEKPSLHRAACTEPIFRSLIDIGDRLADTMALTTLSSTMSDLFDEIGTNDLLETHLELLKKDLADLQKEASKPSGECLESALINTRAQSIGAFVAKVTVVVDAMQTKLKEHATPSADEIRAYTEKSNCQNIQGKNSLKP